MTNQSEPVKGCPLCGESEKIIVVSRDASHNYSHIIIQTKAHCNTCGCEAYIENWNHYPRKSEQSCSPEKVGGEPDVKEKWEVVQRMEREVNAIIWLLVDRLRKNGDPMTISYDDLPEDWLLDSIKSTKNPHDVTFKARRGPQV